MPRLRQIVSVTSHTLGPLPIRPEECKFKPSHNPREHQPAVNPNCGGYTEGVKGASLECSLNDNADCQVDYDRLNALTNDNITIEYSDGTVYMMPKSWTAEGVEPDNGELKVKFESNRSERIT